MQRIDENTYIDDTLVTCAEYQLFIDEMREQGKNHQPDHWTSYQFPKGQSRKSILGVRHSDAVAFCEWLTQREGGIWKYRLPMYEETTRFPIEHLQQGNVGYWIMNVDTSSPFVWISSISTDVRGIARALALDRSYNIFKVQDISNVINQPLDLDIVLTNAQEVAQVFYDANITGRTYIRHAYSNPRDLPYYRIIHLVQSLYRDLTFALDRKLDESLANALDIVITLTDKPNIDFGFYIDLFTLQERIEGRSPAFEGIRLVKERIG